MSRKSALSFKLSVKLLNNLDVEKIGFVVEPCRLSKLTKLKRKKEKNIY